jgi:hypothetical protein
MHDPSTTRRSLLTHATAGAICLGGSSIYMPKRLAATEDSIKDLEIGASATVSDKANIRIVAREAITSLVISDCRNVTIDQLRFEPRSDYALKVRSSTGVNVLNNEFTRLADWPTSAGGYWIGSSADVRFEGNRFSGMFRCGVHDHISGLKVVRNDCREVQSDGFDFVGCVDVEIAWNRFNRFNPQTGDHPDCIQFWTRTARGPSERIHIHDNLFRMGDTPLGAQFIFLGNEDEIPYRDVTIENNLSESTYPHGIYLDLVEHAVVRRNTCVQKVDTVGRPNCFISQINLKRATGNMALHQNLANTIALDAVRIKNGYDGNLMISSVTDASYLRFFEDLTSLKAKVNAGATI